jgi:hypothetical protein
VHTHTCACMEKQPACKGQGHPHPHHPFRPLPLCSIQNSCVCQIQYRVLIIPHTHSWDEKLDEVKLSKMVPPGPIVMVSRSVWVIFFLQPFWRLL